MNREPITHQVKVWPLYFAALVAQTKPFEVRKADRDYRVDDWLFLEEYDPATSAYTGRTLHRRITYRLDGGAFGIEAGYCVLGLARL